MDDTYGLSGVNFINMLLRVLMLWPFTYISPTILSTTFPVHLTKSYALIYALRSKPVIPNRGAAAHKGALRRC
jgi:hypothetical protein